MDGQRSSKPPSPPRCDVLGDSARRERGIAALARRQHGLVTRAQLRSVGLSAQMIDDRVRDHRLRREYRGVYLIGPVPPPLAREMAAILACGEGAVLSHRAAAEMLAIMRPRGRPEHIDVTVVGRGPRARTGIRVHRVAALDRRDVRVRYRVPVTAPARTLLDLASELREAELEQALAEAQTARLVRRADLGAVLTRYPRHRGGRALREALDGSPTLTRSQAERRLLELVRRAGLPEPETQVRIGPYEVDFLWRGDRLIVEVDGFRFHSSRAAFERDRLRDADLNALGYRVVRVTWRQIVNEPEATLVRLARLVSAEG